MLPLHKMTPQPVSPDSETGDRSPAKTTTWIPNLLAILYVLIFGLPLLYFPWSTSWENNYLLFLCPQIQPLVSNPFFKGAVLGLGIANILIGIRQFVNYKSVSNSYISR
jgi:hypothetical protein